MNLSTYESAETRLSLHLDRSLPVPYTPFDNLENILLTHEEDMQQEHDFSRQGWEIVEDIHLEYD